jgi:hypothetical protein
MTNFLELPGSGAVYVENASFTCRDGWELRRRLAHHRIRKQTSPRGMDPGTWRALVDSNHRPTA